MTGQITADELARSLEAPDAPLVLDVREPWEIAIARLPGTVDIPMAEVPQRLADLPRDRQIAVLCHIGGRSQRVAAFLAAQGFNAVNVAGGIHAWSLEVDSDIPVY